MELESLTKRSDFFQRFEDRIANYNRGKPEECLVWEKYFWKKQWGQGRDLDIVAPNPVSSYFILSEYV